MEKLREIYDKLYRYRCGITAALIGILLLLQRTVLSFRYFPVSDDWFLYYERYVEGISPDSLNLATRPFAGLFDVFVIAPLSNHLILIQLLLIAMMAASAYWFIHAMSMNRISCGTIAVLILFMLPVGFEGLYWIAAGSRIIPSLAFISLSAYTFTSYIKNGSMRHLTLYTVSSILAVGFYEMFIPLYIAVSVVIVLINRKGYRVLGITAAAVLLAAVYYLINGSTPDIAGRATIVEFGTILSHTGYVFKTLWEMLWTYGLQMTYDAFGDGLGVFTAHPVYLVLVILAAALTALFAERKSSLPHAPRNLLIGLTFMAAGTAINFVMGYVRMPFRLSVPMLLGAGIMVEVIFSAGLNNIVYKSMVFVLAVVLSVCNAGALKLYRDANAADTENVARLLTDARVTDKHHVVFVCNERPYRYKDRVQYYEYVKAAGESYASLTAMVKYMSGVTEFNNIIPLYDNVIVGENDYTRSYMDMIYVDKDGTIRDCRVIPLGQDYCIENDEGSLVGTLTYENGSYRYTTGEEFR